LNLAVWFASQTFWPDHLVDRFAVGVGLLAFIGLYRFKFSVVWVVAGCGVLGLVWKMTGKA